MPIARVPAAFALVAFLGVASAPATAAAPDCDRKCLQQVADLYFDALAQHQPTLLPLAPDVKYTETGRPLKLGEGIWKNAAKPTYRFDLLDPVSGGIGSHVVLMAGNVPTIMALRLKVRNHLITEVESILVAKRGPNDFAAPEKLVTPPRYFTRKIRAAEQNSRYELMAAADAYFRAFETEGTPEYIRAPLLPDTVRNENGFQTTLAALGNFPASTAAEQFDSAAFKGAMVSDRRYPVVDTEIGAVMSWVRFGDPNGSGPPPVGAPPPAGGNAPAPAVSAAPNYAPFVAETFAITQGKIVEIQAIFTSPTEKFPTPFMGN
jgi:hypothetical protein